MLSTSINAESNSLSASRQSHDALLWDSIFQATGTSHNLSLGIFTTTVTLSGKRLTLPPLDCYANFVFNSELVLTAVGVCWAGL